ncbi:energy transducer TonB [Brevundimonas basaltis]|uniref:energy transducer TonB n=1 Tax=Brevundimonas basaltis TaxID=472166 RepID=UPI001C864D18
MKIRSFLTRDRQRKAGVFVVVLAVHAGLFAVMARTTASPPMALPPVFEVELFRPPPPPPPPPPPEEASVDPGGGAPAAPSRIHVPPPPRDPTPPEVPAPRQQAPEPELVIGVAPTSSETPGMGQGGQGTGRGTGVGAGDGPGRGVRTGPRNLREPRPLALRRYHPQEALRQGVSGTAVVSCRIREDTVLDQCRVVSETPAGQGFGAAGIAAAVAEYRFRPGMIDGRPDYDLRAVITVRFGRNAP